ncbi:uncharacterized protein LOC132626315 [Lycium barbarum]|uniref:uncharacterized protein LOC132626315 n=1 Tax=Lycium barbarum TaxID=112863 RepID=UPI00293F4C21|nr:uncharacterized protein LOC132626315 [Lycium barbarum]XP_060197120.1 uncharacterized protein LOC132626315 [Lycium barbarum]XP_060197121.1 uncharacterized protein LOC132626315 [Lycium barbarum]XP_060197122.1 uncharacterized protein LOC132626315 [Lycium barbarum]XP_060197123.1 uncharacterized protein LOC132626315 [Lycium barbarum]XP_060197124.1 uncharacterized protein LOC132626315 [Lycium barbarum]XP_060197125.1 uncharacterized protein LOC132626315 [Lycium barbarum]XP_060197126.1 uncharacte
MARRSIIWCMRVEAANLFLDKHQATNGTKSLKEGEVYENETAKVHNSEADNHSVVAIAKIQQHNDDPVQKEINSPQLDGKADSLEVKEAYGSKKSHDCQEHENTELSADDQKSEMVQRRVDEVDQQLGVENRGSRDADEDARQRLDSNRIHYGNEASEISLENQMAECTQAGDLYLKDGFDEKMQDMTGSMDQKESTQALILKDIFDEEVHSSNCNLQLVGYYPEKVADVEQRNLALAIIPDIRDMQPLNVAVRVSPNKALHDVVSHKLQEEHDKLNLINNKKEDVDGDAIDMKLQQMCVEAGLSPKSQSKGPRKGKKQNSEVPQIVRYSTRSNLKKSVK